MLFGDPPKGVLVPLNLTSIECDIPSFKLPGTVKLKPCMPFPTPELIKSWRNWSAGTVITRTLSLKISTLIGVFGWVESHAQPEMVLQFATSWKPRKSGLLGGAQVTLFGVLNKPMKVPVNPIAIECDCPSFRLFGRKKLNP